MRGGRWHRRANPRRRTMACRPCERLLASRALPAGAGPCTRDSRWAENDGSAEIAAIDLWSQADLALAWRCGRDTPETDRQVDFGLGPRARVHPAPRSRVLTIQLRTWCVSLSHRVRCPPDTMRRRARRRSRVRATSDLTHPLGWCAAQSCEIPLGDIGQRAVGAANHVRNWRQLVRLSNVCLFLLHDRHRRPHREIHSPHEFRAT